MPKFMRLVKLGALGGVAFGVVQAMKRRRRDSASESSWPTLAETAVKDGHSFGDGNTADDDSTTDESPESRHEADGTTHSKPETSAEADGEPSEGAEHDADADSDSAEHSNDADGKAAKENS